MSKQIKYNKEHTFILNDKGELNSYDFNMLYKDVMVLAKHQSNKLYGVIETEELCHDLCVKIILNIHKINLKSASLKTYVSRMMHNMIGDYLRVSKYRRRYGLDEYLMDRIDSDLIKYEDTKNNGGKRKYE